MQLTIIGPDGQPRCAWAGSHAGFFAYHDEEWGYPVKDDQRLFEKLCLESFQSGLSWRTILAKRENFRRAFAQFDYVQIAKFTERDVERLLQDEGIIRHRGKIEAVINNARQAPALASEFGSLAAFFWSFEPPEQAVHQAQQASTSAQSEAMSRALKKRGWKFVGPTTLYALMQAMGLINDHVAGCVCRQRVAQARAGFVRPELGVRYWF